MCASADILALTSAQPNTTPLPPVAAWNTTAATAGKVAVELEVIHAATVAVALAQAMAVEVAVFVDLGNEGTSEP